jgi:CarboxypepD_reg-like domain
MSMKNLCLSILLALPAILVYGQKTDNTDPPGKLIAGFVLDTASQEPLPYANIFIKGKTVGVISNENGRFSFRNIQLVKNDTIGFRYLGYKTKYIPANNLDSNSMVYLKEEIINLNELLVFGNAPDARKIVKNVLVYKDSNYVKETSKEQAFIRERYITDIDKMELDCKKSSIPELDDDMVELIQNKIPKYTTSYTDFLGDLYLNKNTDDSVPIKIDPTRIVSLKEKDIAELDRVEEVFKKLLKNTEDDEYWKFRTGILSQKMDMDEPEKDTVSDTIKDTIPDNYRRTKYYDDQVKGWLKFTTFENDKQWEFLYKTSRYAYTLVGGTRVNGEEVYIIDFKPDNSGMYTGRLFISKETYALIRADFKYASGKNGRDIHLFGVGYTEDQFRGSIYFEKGGSKYRLKYFSYKSGNTASVDRSFSVMKKKDRFLFDKTENEIKIGLDLVVDNEESVEFLVLNSENISQENFRDFQQPENMEVIYVDQFDENLWKGYSIIEPIQKMKEYKKQGDDFLQ